MAEERIVTVFDDGGVRKFKFISLDNTIPPANVPEIPPSKIQLPAQTLVGNSDASVDGAAEAIGIGTGLTLDNGVLSSTATAGADPPLFYNSTTGVFSIQQSTTGDDGYLSAADWNTFNGKANTGDLPSGNTNQIGYFSDPAHIVSSPNLIFDGATLFTNSGFVVGDPDGDSGMTAFDKSQALGLSTGGGIIHTLAEGSIAAGAAINGGLIQADQQGAFAFGKTDGGNIFASGEGTIGFGYTETGGTINGAGIGAFAGGYAKENHILRASGQGSFIYGAAVDADHIASGRYSAAIGIDLAVEGDNAISFGRGFTNSDTNTFKIGWDSEQFAFQRDGGRFRIAAFAGGGTRMVTADSDGNLNVQAIPSGVTSVNVSGGATGLTFSGGAITTSGTITMAGTLGVANGGTGRASYAIGDMLWASASGTLSTVSGNATGTRKFLSQSGNGVNPSVPAWNQIALGSDVTGILPAANGGTGQNTSAWAQGDVPYLGATGTWSNLPKSTTASRYLSNTGTSNNPAWAQINLTNGTTGVLPAASGGAGAVSGILKADGSGTVSAAGAGTDYESPLTFSTGLTRTSNTVTADLATGKAGGLTAKGGTASGETLTLSSTTHATKGKLLFGTSAYDEANNRLIVNGATSAANHKLVIINDDTNGGIVLRNSADNANLFRISRNADTNVQLELASSNVNCIQGVGTGVTVGNGATSIALQSISVTAGNVTNTSTSGARNIFSITPTYNQASGSASNTDFTINRTETAVGSGAQLLADWQIGGASKFSFSNGSLATLTKLAIGSTQVDTAGFLLQNTTSAALGAQQYSPSIVQSGRGWATTGSTSQAVNFRTYVQPVQGTANATANQITDFSVGGGAYTTLSTLSSAGGLTIIGTMTAPVLSITQQNADNVISGSLAIGGGAAIGQQKFHINQNNQGWIATAVSTLTLGGVNTGYVGLFQNASALNTTTTTFIANNNYAAFIYGNTAQSIFTAASGTHAIAANVAIKAITFTANPSTPASISDAATVYIEGAPTGTATITRPWSLFVDAGAARFDGNLDFSTSDSTNFVLGTTTGTKIGTSTSQKCGFWNATPIVQPTTAVASAAFASAFGGTVIQDIDQFDGYTVAQVVKALRNIGILA